MKQHVQPSKGAIAYNPQERAESERDEEFGLAISARELRELCPFANPDPRVAELVLREWKTEHQRPARELMAYRHDREYAQRRIGERAERERLAGERAREKAAREAEEKRLSDIRAEQRRRRVELQRVIDGEDIEDLREEKAMVSFVHGDRLSQWSAEVSTRITRAILHELYNSQSMDGAVRQIQKKVEHILIEEGQKVIRAGRAALQGKT